MATWAVPASAGPVKVFILAGQSEMEGQAVVDLTGASYNNGNGNLNDVMADVIADADPANDHRYDGLKDANGNWMTRSDVWLRYQTNSSGLIKRNLTVGYSTVYADSHHFGAELQFGRIVGDYYDDQVLLIKTAWGGKNLYADFRPPSSGGTTGPYYTKMIGEVRSALGNIANEFSGYGGQGYEIAGFVWWQGWNDSISSQGQLEYRQNLVNLVTDVRAELQLPNLPTLICELGQTGVNAGSDIQVIRNAQAAAAGALSNAAFVSTTAFARLAAESPNPTQGHHWYGNAESFFLIGDALGKAMIAPTPPPPPNPSNLAWTGGASGTWDVNTTANFSGGASGKFTNGDTVTFGNTGGNTTITVAAGGVAPANVTFTNTTANSYTISGGSGATMGLIKGSVNMVISGGGQVTLAGANSYYGSTTVSSGTLVLGNRTAAGSSTLTLAGGVTFQTGFTGNSAGGALPNTIVLSGGLVRVNVAFGSTTQDIWLNAPVSGPGGLLVTGSGRTQGLTLSGVKTFEGGVTLGAPGTTETPNVSIDHVASLGTGTLRSEIKASDLTRGGLRVNANLDSGSGVANKVEIASGARLVVNTLGYNLLLSGQIQGGGSLVKYNTGSLILSGQNIYAGGTKVLGGTLVIASIEGLPPGRSLSIGTGSTLILGGGMSLGASNNAAAPVPEPGTLALLAVSGLAGWLLWRRKS